MTAAETTPALDASAPLEHLDVVIVGAGLSGIGAACLLRQECPAKSFAILEARDAIGGTWDLFRYPGIRSDSDMFTLGYSFRPWTKARAIADGPSIREYIRDTAREYGIDRAVRFGHRVIAADWDGDAGRWTVTAERGDTGATVRLTCSWLSVCAGYYDYAAGYRPHLPGEERFEGTFVHPQGWPEDLDWAGKHVVVIGSGATAVTLVPNLAQRAAHVTMLQRTPTYVLSLPGIDPLAEFLHRRLPARAAHPLIKWKNVLVSTGFYQFARRRPEAVKAFVRKGVRRALPHGYDVDTHFNPPYDPWDQRMCFVPDGDLFRALAAGTAEVVTDHIETFTPTGIRLRSGRELDADIVVTATGLALLPIGGMRLSVDGEPVDVADTVSYKGMMLSGVPNFNLVIGYTNASWTLKADLVNRYVTRLLKHLDAHGFDRATPQPPRDEPADQPFLDFNSGYVQRSLHRLPRQGRRAPWRLYQNYLRDVVLMRYGRLQDDGMLFSHGRPVSRPAPTGREATVSGQPRG
ncbi:NAD(P)/FAD-dependent oxidoreductase [Planosporangium thailandense]|uniref:NAD(P)/FAD-dependent oxidoreductase n=1 Tax=Planosporangium thailandense TaxID=765197 RepID=A0ABX0Y7I6_9ACTN|nr:NAD(P)/FAD-dependent oxidoreductase [Planosporangium thailandense]NJC74036.1 NAD(P)/FAD-dependent oxidoreductase [Planosporangium thailandense]